MKYPFHIEQTETSRLGTVNFKDLAFGKLYGDHMFVAECKQGRWSDCKIIPYGNLYFSPASSALHYGQIIFEGMKAYKDPYGHPQLFRPEKNHKRFNRSAARMGMAEVPEELWHDALHELINLDHEWIPEEQGCSLYVRPFMFATDRFIGIRPTEFFKFLIITSPAGSYYSKPVKVIASDHYVRAFVGGVGFAKAAGNYGATMLPLKEAQKQGFDQVLWTDGIEHRYAQEIGTMNVFFVVDGIAITPNLDGTILDGVTRDSVIQLLKSYGIKVEERKISLDELADAHKKGHFMEAFGTGTAASITAISHIGYKGAVMELPPIDSMNYSSRLKQDLEEIKTSKVPDPFGWVVKVKSKLVPEEV